MCCCGKPTINGEPHAYSWDGKSFMTYQPHAPKLDEGDELIYDLPGRCGGTDSHSYHLRLVKARIGGHALLVQHGGGAERHSLGYDRRMVALLETVDDGARYWFLMSFYHLMSRAVRDAVERNDVKWRQAAADKRIKTRRSRHTVKVWIESAPVLAVAETV